MTFQFQNKFFELDKFLDKKYQIPGINLYDSDFDEILFLNSVPLLLGLKFQKSLNMKFMAEKYVNLFIFINFNKF